MRLGLFHHGASHVAQLACHRWGRRARASRIEARLARTGGGGAGGSTAYHQERVPGAKAATDGGCGGLLGGEQQLARGAAALQAARRRTRPGRPRGGRRARDACALTCARRRPRRALNLGVGGAVVRFYETLDRVGSQPHFIPSSRHVIHLSSRNSGNHWSNGRQHSVFSEGQGCHHHGWR